MHEIPIKKSGKGKKPHENSNIKPNNDIKWRAILTLMVYADKPDESGEVGWCSRSQIPDNISSLQTASANPPIWLNSVWETRYALTFAFIQDDVQTSLNLICWETHLSHLINKYSFFPFCLSLKPVLRDLSSVSSEDSSTIQTRDGPQLVLFQLNITSDQFLFNENFKNLEMSHSGQLFNFSGSICLPPFFLYRR